MPTIYAEKRFVRHSCGHGETVRLEGDEEDHARRTNEVEAIPCGDCVASGAARHDREAVPVAGELAASLGWRPLLGLHNRVATGTRKRDDIIFKLHRFGRSGGWEAEAAQAALDALHAACGTDTEMWIALKALDASQAIQAAALVESDYRAKLEAILAILAVQHEVGENLDDDTLDACGGMVNLGSLIAQAERGLRNLTPEEVESSYYRHILVRLRGWHGRIMAAQDKLAAWKRSPAGRSYRYVTPREPEPPSAEDLNAEFEARMGLEPPHGTERQTDYASTIRRTLHEPSGLSSHRTATRAGSEDVRAIETYCGTNAALWIGTVKAARRGGDYCFDDAVAAAAVLVRQWTEILASMPTLPEITVGPTPDKIAWAISIQRKTAVMLHGFAARSRQHRKVVNKVVHTLRRWPGHEAQAWIIARDDTARGFLSMCISRNSTALQPVRELLDALPDDSG